MISTEDLFIRSCARLKADDQLPKKVEGLVTQALNWDYILRRAQEQGVAGLLYKFILEKNLTEKIPVTALGVLKNYYYSLLQRNILILKEWEEVLAQFAQERIEALVFKGPALLELVYKDYGLRPMGDIDILVKPQDLRAAGRVLEAKGYTATLNAESISSNLRLLKNPLNLEQVQRNSIIYSRNEEKQAFFWHIYWHLVNFLPYNRSVLGKIDMSRIWEQASYCKASGFSWRGFSLYHNLIYLSLHSFSHRYEPLILLCDLHELIQSQKENIDWDVLIEEAEALGLEKYLYYGLQSLVKIMGTAIPQRALGRLKPARVTFWERRFMTAVSEGRPFFLSEIFTSLAMNENTGDKCAYLSALLFPSRQEMAVIRQKDIARVGIADYLKRIIFSFCFYKKG